jgi:hypothetical protein
MLFDSHFDPATVLLPTGLAVEAVSGVQYLLTRMSHDAGLQAAEAGVAWAAYMLATVEHETWSRFAPVEEEGRGEGKRYGVSLRTVCADGTVRQNAYYGRGYVQLTWQANYARLGNALGLGRSLVERPELALDPDIAYSILSFGMTRGAFTGKSLGCYLTASSRDYVQARRIINGLDCAQEIAELAVHWEKRLQEAPRRI